MNLNQGQIQLLGIAILFCITLIVLFGMAMNSYVGEKGLIIKAEFAESCSKLNEIVGQRQEGVKFALLIDTVGFIPVYFLLFTLLIWFLTRQENPLSPYLAIMAGVLAVATIFFDLFENVNLYQCLAGNSENVGIISSMTFAKWFCFFVTTAVLSSVFWHPNWLAVIAGLFIVGSIGGIVLLFTKQHQLIEYSVLSVVLGILIVGISFTFFSTNIIKVFNGK